MTRLLRLVPVTTQFDLKKAVKERLKAARAGGEGEGNNHLEGELGEGFLERNIGIPLVVVGCKADSLQSETFEQQQRLHFIQQSLRRFCLQCESQKRVIGCCICGMVRRCAWVSLYCTHRLMTRDTIACMVYMCSRTSVLPNEGTRLIMNMPPFKRWCGASVHIGKGRRKLRPTSPISTQLPLPGCLPLLR